LQQRRLELQDTSATKNAIQQIVGRERR
jgi:hypothetical protein